MKKIIALAVASAFVAPVMAADLTISGAMTYNYIDTDLADTDAGITTDDNKVVFSAVQELESGLTVTGTFNIVQDTAAAGDTLQTQSSNLSIAGPFGKVTVGDTSNGLDAFGDYTDVSPVFGGFSGDGYDAPLAWQLPTIAEGLKIVVSTSPKGVNRTTEGSGTEAEAEGNGGSAYGLSFAPVAGVEVYYGKEEFDRDATNKHKTNAYGLKYAAGPFMIAYEAGSGTNVDDPTATTSAADGDDLKYRGIAGTYSMGDIKVGFEMQEAKDKNASEGTDKHIDATILFASYNLGGGLSVYAASSNDDTNVAAQKASSTAVGVSFAF